MCNAAELALAEDDVVGAANLLLHAERIFDDIGGHPSGLDGSMYRKTWDRVRGRLGDAELSELREALAPKDVEEASDCLLHYLD